MKHPRHSTTLQVGGEKGEIKQLQTYHKATTTFGDKGTTWGSAKL